MSNYVDLDELKLALGITSTEFDDLLEGRYCTAASDAIDELCSTSFKKGTSAVERVYTAQGPLLCLVDDMASITEVAVDRSGSGTYTELETTHWFSMPENHAAKNRAIRWLKARPARGTFPLGDQAIKVTGILGWPKMPTPVVTAAMLLTTQLWKRQRESPHGILGLDQQTASRVLRDDPHLCLMIEPYMRAEEAA